MNLIRLSSLYYAVSVMSSKKKKKKKKKSPILGRKFFIGPRSKTQAKTKFG